MKKVVIILCLLGLAGMTVREEMRVASVFSDHMVIQRGKKVPVWGEAAPGETVVVEFNGQKQKTVTGTDGRWRVTLSPMKANRKGQPLTIKGEQHMIVLKDVVIGDIWIMAGQSNMFRDIRSMGPINKEAVEKADNPQIRYFKVPPKVATRPQSHLEAKWGVLDKDHVTTLTAIGVIFAEKIQPVLNVPVGILSVNMGSTSVECWVPMEIMQKPPFLETWRYWEKELDQWDRGGYEKYLELQQKQASRKKKPFPTRENMIRLTETRTFPSGAYNAMLHPLFPFSVKGIVWRQGEANASRAEQYKKLLPVMIRHWRKKFQDDSLPFIQIGLPAYGTHSKKPGESVVAELRAAQQKIARSVPGCYYIPILDLNDVHQQKGNIHPRNKYLAGCRTALFVLGNIYRTTQKIEIPLLESYQVKNDKVILTFTGVGDSLFTGRLADLKGDSIAVTREPVNNFIIAGRDRKFVPAHARITGKNRIEVWSDAVKRPASVRYAWDNLVLNINLYNSSKMPASSFRTDSWPLSTEGNHKPRISLVLPR